MNRKLGRYVRQLTKATNDLRMLIVAIRRLAGSFWYLLLVLLAIHQLLSR